MSGRGQNDRMKQAEAATPDATIAANRKELGYGE